MWPFLITHFPDIRSSLYSTLFCNRQNLANMQCYITSTIWKALALLTLPISNFATRTCVKTRTRSCVETPGQPLLQYWEEDGRISIVRYLGSCIFLSWFSELAQPEPLPGQWSNSFPSSDELAFPVSGGRQCFQGLCQPKCHSFSVWQNMEEDLCSLVTRSVLASEGTTAPSLSFSKGLGLWSRKAFKYTLNFMSSPAKASERNGTDHMLKVKPAIHRSSSGASL